MRVRVRHKIDRLARDQERIATEAPAGMVRVVSDNVDYGRDLTRASARVTAGKHGRRYPDSITSEMTSAGGGSIVGEWGADPSKPQGGMDFERGSGRQTKPHLNHQKAADIVAPEFARDTRRLVSRLFR